ncbi:hypothetical protein GGR56DRAFT_674563 [Xylariaceae sp. FL0804]|nr:hypothetical protein GGR56DRAFT_674563 [Xylariaceae sp. FL0804]
MPLFSSHKAEDEVVEQPAPLPEKKHGLFNRHNRSPSPPATVRSSTSSRRSADTTTTSGTASRHRSVLSRLPGGIGGSSNPEMDPSIVQARERVMSAETAEREADRALAAARVRVREARAEVKRLEEEAAEEARRAKIKQYHAREVSKRGKQLGRHDL